MTNGSETTPQLDVTKADMLAWLDRYIDSQEYMESPPSSAVQAERTVRQIRDVITWHYADPVITTFKGDRDE